MLRSSVPEVLFLVSTTTVGLWAAGRWLDPFGDPGIWWTLVYRLGRGERLYRDVFLQYGPLSPYLLSFVGRLTGLSATSFLLMNWVPAILLGLILLRAGGPYLGQLERVCVAGLLIGGGIFGPGRAARLVLPYSPAAVHALILSVLSLCLLQRAPTRRVDAFLAGGLAGLAFSSKQEIGLVALAALCVPVWTRSSGARGWVLPALAGFCCLVLPGLLVVFASASVESLRYDNHYWPLAEVPAAWKFLYKATTGLLNPDWPARLTGAALSFLFVAALVGLLGLLLARDPRVRRPLLLFLLGALLVGGAVDGVLLGRRADPSCLSMLVAFALVLAAYLNREQPGRDFLVAFGLFAGLLASRTAFAGRLDWSSYSGVANVLTSLTWALFLFCFLPRLFPGGKLAGGITRRIWALVLLPVATYGTWSSARDLRSQDAVAVETPRGRVWDDGPAVPFLAALAANLRPGERALVLPESNAIEALFDLQSTSPLLYHLPGWLDARAESALLRRFETKRPDVVVLFIRPTWEYGVDPFGQGFGRRLGRWLVQNYRRAASAQGGIILRSKVPG
jgi:hypothetical protein